MGRRFRLANVEKRKTRILAQIRRLASRGTGRATRRPSLSAQSGSRSVESAADPELLADDIEREHGGIGDIERLDLAGHVDAGQRIAGIAGDRA